MIRFILTVTFLVSSVTANAADKALMLSDAEQAALIQILDVATKAQGIGIAQNTTYFLNKIKSAPSVVPHVDEPPPITPSIGPKEQNQ